MNLWTPRRVPRNFTARSGAPRRKRNGTGGAGPRRCGARGFTLIELLVTLGIIVILAAVAIPSYIGYRLRAERTVAWGDLQNLRLLEEQYYAENGAYTGPLANTAAIQGMLPAFNPDPASMYSYNITGDAFSFTAWASRASDSAAPFRIDNNNNRNF